MTLRPVGSIDFLVTYTDLVFPKTLQYNQDGEKGQLYPTGWWRTPERKIILSETIGRSLATDLHSDTHLGSMKLSKWLRPRCLSQMTSLSSRKSKTVLTQERSPNERPTPHVTLGSWLPWDPTCQGRIKYLLVFTNVFSRWVDAFPNWTETAQTITENLLQELVP